MGTRGNRSEAPWTFYSDRGIATLNATIAGKRCRASLGIAYDPATASARHVREIEAAAARRYAELVAGRVLEVGPQARILTSHTLHELFALWLVEAEKLWPRSYKTRISQIGAVEAWADNAPRFKGDKRAPIERLLDDAGPAQFAADRVVGVLRGTVDGELSNLYAFFDWAKTERHIASAPPRPTLPRGALGKRVGPQRAQPVDITEEEALAMCAVMPEWTARGGSRVGRGPGSKNAIRVRDVFRLCWELALRPGIAQKISVPLHYVRGQEYVWISRDIDKIGLERRIPLTRVAKEILERCAPDEGVIFGVHELTHQIKRAAAVVLPPEKAKNFARYDFRHGRAVHSIEVAGNLLGTQRMLGHEKATTTDRYVRTREAHAAAMVAKLDAAAGAVRTESGRPTDGASSQETTAMKSTVKHGPTNKTPDEHHRSSGPSSLHLPKNESAGFSGDLREDRRDKGVKNRDESVTESALSSGTGQEAPPAILTTAQRIAAFNGIVWDAFDTFSLHAMGVDFEDAQ